MRGILRSILLMASLAGQASMVMAHLPDGVFQTAEGAMIEDCFDACIERKVTALFTLDTAAGAPYLLSAALLDPLRPPWSPRPSLVTVASESVLQSGGHTVEFSGEYLPGYVFRWRFTRTETGEVLWNGDTAWTGGRLDLMTITDVRLLPIQVTPGDYNGNGHVEQADLDLVLLNWGTELTDPAGAGWHNDLPDGIVDQAELDSVLLDWGRTATGVGMASVPEPVARELLAIAAGVYLLVHVLAAQPLRFRRTLGTVYLKLLSSNFFVAKAGLRRETHLAGNE
jgi:hypothetical protein